METLLTLSGEYEAAHGLYRSGQLDSASRRAQAKPMPLAAPVTMAVLFSSAIGALPCCCPEILQIRNRYPQN